MINPDDLICFKGNGGSGGRGGRGGGSISTDSNSGFRIGDNIKIASRELSFEGSVVKINTGSVKLRNSWGQETKPIKLTRLSGGTLTRQGRSFNLR